MSQLSVVVSLSEASMTPPRSTTLCSLSIGTMLLMMKDFCSVKRMLVRSLRSYSVSTTMVSSPLKNPLNLHLECNTMQPS